MKPVMVPEWGWATTGATRESGGCRCSRLKAVGRQRQHRYRVCSCKSVRTDVTLSGARNWSAYAREQFMKGRLIVERASGPLLVAPQRLFAGELIVLMCMDQVPRAAHRLRQRGNLLIARGFMRQREIAVRVLEIGAARRRLDSGGCCIEVSRTTGGAGLFIVAVARARCLALVPLCARPTILIQRLPMPGCWRSPFASPSPPRAVFGLLPALRASRPNPWTT